MSESLSPTKTSAEIAVKRSPYHRRRTCRACGSRRLWCFIELGPTPLANSFLRSISEFAAERSYPLDLFICRECSLVQLLDVVGPEVLFKDYIYVTGTSGMIAAHNREYSRTVVERLDLGGRDLIVEVASNNGSLLKCFREYGVRTLGVEPATNLAEIANADGVETLNEFFDSSQADIIRSQYGRAKVVIGNNVLAHVDDTKDFLLGCRMLLAEDGLVIIEVPYLRDFVERTEFDTVYHEHLCYFGVNSFISLCDAVGLSIRRIERVAVHGGSIRVYAGRRERFGGHAFQVRNMAAEEVASGLTDPATYDRFAERARSIRTELVSLLKRLRSEGYSIAGYGAPAKGNTLLNYCGIDTGLIDFTVDKNVLKVGTYTPGAHLPVLPVSALAERQPDFVLILAWNFADEIIAQESEFRERGGRFIVPIPDPTIV